MQSITFTIPGRIGGKGRPRFARRGNFVQTFSDSKTRNAEAMIRDLAQQAMAARRPFEGPISLNVVVNLNMPMSWSKKKRAASGGFVTGKPDADNVLKLVGDALNGIVWKDDSQISDAHIIRRYRNDRTEAVEIEAVSLMEEATQRAICPRCEQPTTHGQRHDCQPLNAVAEEMAA